MYGCESWTIKKAEHQRIDVFELWCWRRLLRVLWTARRSNQSILKEISPEYSLKGLMLKLKLQYFGHLIQRGDLLEKTLMLGNIGGRRRRGRQRMRWLDGIIDSMHMGLGGLRELVMDREAWHAAVHGVGHDWATELNWTECELLDPKGTQEGENIFGLPRWYSGKESAYQRRRRKRHRFDPWVGKVPCRRKRQPTPVFLPGKFHEQKDLARYRPWGRKQLDPTEQLSTQRPSDCSHSLRWAPWKLTVWRT